MNNWKNILKKHQPNKKPHTHEQEQNTAPKITLFKLNLTEWES